MLNLLVDWRKIGFIILAAICPIKTFAQSDMFTGSENEWWKHVDMNSMLVKKGTALDMSRLIESGPAGKYGRVVLGSDGHLVFQNRPDKRIIFFGAAGTGRNELIANETHAGIEKIADALKIQGYNMFRVIALPLMSGNELEPLYLEKFDYFVKCLKDRGIYLNFAQSPDDGVKLFYDSSERDKWKNAMTKLLTHVNQYTGMALKDDPVVAILLFKNEQEIKPATEALKPSWQQFLSQKYGTMDALRLAWQGSSSLPSGDTFDAVPIYTGSQAWASDSRSMDIAAFCNMMSRGMLDFYKSWMQEVGYTGLYTQYDFHKSLYLTEVRNQMPVLTMHNYHDHPTDTHLPGSTILQSSTFSDELSWIRTVGGPRFFDRPYMITEYGHVYWNKYRYEEGIMLGSYAALQDWDLLAAHQAQIRTVPEKMMTFHVALDPVARASQLVSQYLFLRRDVSTARSFIDFRMNKADMNLLKGYAMMSSELNRLMLVSGFGISYSGEDPSFLPADKRDSDTVLYKTITDQGFTLSNFISHIRSKGWLTQSNRTDPANKVYESDNGELFLNVNKNLFTVNTPRLEGMCFSSLVSPVTLNTVTVESCNVPAMVSIISLKDTLKISKSNHLLLVFTPHALNTGMTFRDTEKKILESYGTLPPLMQTGQLKVTLKSDVKGFVKLWALNIDGTRKDSLIVSMNGEKIVFNLDTRTLKNGNTPFFEIFIDTTLEPNYNNDPVSDNDEFLLYPNPADDSVFLKFYQLKPGRNQVNVYNINGRRMIAAAENFSSGSNEWEIPFEKRLAKGIYLLQLVREKNTSSKILIID